MSAKFHINPETGAVGPCNAKIKCAFTDAEGNEPQHYKSLEEAGTASEKLLSEQYGDFTSYRPYNDQAEIVKEQLWEAKHARDLDEFRATLEAGTVPAERVIEFVQRVGDVDDLYKFIEVDRDDINITITNQSDKSWEMDGVPSELANQLMKRDYDENNLEFVDGLVKINWFSQDKFNEYNVQITVTPEMFISLEDLFDALKDQRKDH